MSKLVKKRIIEKVLAGAVFISMFLPIFGIKHHHECEYDECLKVFVDYKFGECVESTIEDMVLIIAVVWYVAIYGGGMILNKDRNAVSPFVFAALLIAQSIFLCNHRSCPMEICSGFVIVVCNFHSSLQYRQQNG